MELLASQGMVVVDVLEDAHSQTHFPDEPVVAVCVNEHSGVM